MPEDDLKKALEYSQWLDECYRQAAETEYVETRIGPLDEEGYFDPGDAPEGGGVAALEELRRAALDHKGRP